MSDKLPPTEPNQPENPEERVLDPSNLEAEWHALERQFQDLLQGANEDQILELAQTLSPGDLSEVLRPLSVEDTASILRLLPPDPLAEVLSEIDNRSLEALFTLLDIDEIADIIEEMPSDEATDLLGELDKDQALEILAAMEEEERGEVTELLQYGPETAGGMMDKEFASSLQSQTCGDAVATLRRLDEDDLEGIHFVYVVSENEQLVGRLPLSRLLVTDPGVLVQEVMEPDPHYVEVGMDQENVAYFFMTHDLLTLPVVDNQMKLLGRITADDVMEVLEDEATEDISRLAGVSKEEFGEPSSLRVARSRLPWLLGALGGQVGAVFVLAHFEKSLESMVALAFYIPMIMGMAGNIGIQTSSVVVRGLATGEVDFYHLGRHLGREMGTAVMTGSAVAGSLVLVSWVIGQDLQLSCVLGLAMLLVIIFAAAVGTGFPLLLHRFGMDPAVATGPFITTANDIFGLLIYLGLASLLLSLGAAPGS